MSHLPKPCRSESGSRFGLPDLAAAATDGLESLSQAFDESLGDEAETGRKAGSQEYPKHFVIWHGFALRIEEYEGGMSATTRGKTVSEVSQRGLR